jgi:hypothetical protein
MNRRSRVVENTQSAAVRKELFTPVLAKKIARWQSPSGMRFFATNQKRCYRSRGQTLAMRHLSAVISHALLVVTRPTSRRFHGGYAPFRHSHRRQGQKKGLHAQALRYVQWRIT